MEYSGAGGNWFMKKTRSKKSRDTVPLRLANFFYCLFLQFLYNSCRAHFLSRFFLSSICRNEIVYSSICRERNVSFSVFAIFILWRYRYLQLHLSRQTCHGQDSNPGRLLASTLAKSYQGSLPIRNIYMRPPHSSPQCITHALHHDVGRMAQRVFSWEDSPITSGSPLCGGTWPGFTRSFTRAHKTDMPRPGFEPRPLTQQARTLAKRSRQLNNIYSEHEASTLSSFFVING